MRYRRATASLVLGLVLVGCGGGGTTDPATDPASQIADDFTNGPTGAVKRANDVADQVNQRTADLENQLNGG